MAVAVQAHRLAQLLELERREFADQPVAAQAEREVGCAMAVQRVTAVVVALAVGAFMLYRKKQRENYQVV